MIFDLKLRNKDQNGPKSAELVSLINSVVYKIISLGSKKTKIIIADEGVVPDFSRFDKVIYLKAMNQKSRLTYINHLLQFYPMNDLKTEQILDLSLRTSGFTITDLQRLFKSSFFASYASQFSSLFDQTKDLKNHQDTEEMHEGGQIENQADEKQKDTKTTSPILSYDLIKTQILQIKPINISSIQTQIPPTPWTSIGGYKDIKQLIQLTIELPLKNPDLYKRKGLNVPKGILFYGPPGCSKTLMARALASESYFNFISIKGPEIFSKYVGDSEKAIRDVFLKARVNSPCIIFFDEIDGIGGKRSGGSGGSAVGDRVLIQLLTEIDGFAGLDDVIVIGATNRPEALDDALMRPGRLDELVYIGLPDGEARREIFEIQKRTMNFEEGIDVDNFVSITEGYTGAEIVQVCKKAGFLSIKRDLEDEFIRQDDLSKAVASIKPRITKHMVERYQRFENKRGKM